MFADPLSWLSFIFAPPGRGGVGAPDSDLEASEATRAVETIVATAPPRDRQVLAMRWDEGMSLDESARALGRSKSGVRVIVQRWQERLRPVFERD